MESTNKVFEQPSKKIPSAGIKGVDPTTGAKYDDGKLRMDLIPGQIIEGLAAVYTMGAKKYDDRNWEKGILYGKIYAAVQRHLQAWWRRDECDKESGLNHLWHAMWGCGALAFYSLFPFKYAKFDDRPSHYDEREIIPELSAGEVLLGKPQHDGPVFSMEHSCWEGFSDGAKLVCTRDKPQRNYRRYN